MRDGAAHGITGCGGKAHATWSQKLRKLSTNGDQKEDKSFRLTDKLLIALYMALGCLDD